jgi:uncharacterized membrane protein YtjA (UPF0391 family)
MWNWKYIFLTVSLIAFAIGFSDAQATTLFDLGRPVGAILFGLFLIVQVFEKESALLDEQMAAEAAQRRNLPDQKSGGISNSEEGLTGPALTTAHSH